MRRPRWLSLRVRCPGWVWRVGRYYGLTHRRPWEPPEPVRIEDMIALQEELNEARAERYIAMARLLKPADIDFSRPFEVRVEAGSMEPPGMSALLDAIVWEWPRDTAALKLLRRQRRDAATLELLALDNVASLARVVPDA